MSGDLKAIFTSEGRIIPFDNNGEIVYKFEYSLKDHLGNSRVVFSGHSKGQPELMQVTDYYPFGMVKNQENHFASGVLSNKYLYNNKELQDDELAGNSLGWYDYGARFYDPELGRWYVIDQLSEKYYPTTPYGYAINNPIAFIDKDGREIEDSKMTNPQSGKYYKSYRYFVNTSQGVNLLRRFTNGNDTRWNHIRNSGEGDLSSHTFRIRPEIRDRAIWKNGIRTVVGDGLKGGTDGVTRVYLKSSNGEVHISKVTADDIMNSKLEFTYEAILAYPNSNEGNTIGHETLLHLGNYVNDIESYMSGFDKDNLSESDYSKIATGLNSIWEGAGDRHHSAFSVKGKEAQEFYNYLNELGNKYSSLQEAISTYINQLQKQYSNE